MLGLSRLWTRQLFKFLLGTAALIAVVIVADTYYNILPPSVQSKILLHQPGHVLTDIKVETCFLKSRCPPSNNEWFRIPKDIYLTKYWGKHGYVYVKRSKEEDLTSSTSVILDVAVSFTPGNDNIPPAYVLKDINDGNDDSKKNEKPKTSTNQPDLIKSKGWKQQEHGVWVKKGKYNPHASVTSLDVLFGSDAKDPRIGWQLRNGFIGGIEQPGPRISARIGPKAERPKVELRVHRSGKFKILQLADLHFSTGVGKCRDLYPKDAHSGEENCSADPRTLEFIEKVLDNEKPDYVVLTGDQIFGETSPDSETAIFKVVAPLISRKIPYSMVMGNHDDEKGSLSRHDLMTLASQLPYSLTQLGPADLSGYGNYVQTVLGPKSDNPALTFYFLDSHANSPNPKKFPGYAWIEPNQLEFVKSEYERLKPSQEAYSHIHMSMAFFHIPIPEYIHQKPMVGQLREGITAPRYNTGVRDVLAKIGVSVLSVGHDHVNDFCKYDDKKEGSSEEEKTSALWLCYGGGAGEGGYGGYGGYERRVRVFEVDTQAATIMSWKLLHEAPETKIDQQLLVQDGKAVLS